MTVAAILVAGGSGTRLGAAEPKAFVAVGGRTLLEHALARFTGHPAIGPVVVVAPASHLTEAARLGPGVTVVAGGGERSDSVAAGLAAVPAGVEHVLVHDVARPFVPAAVIDAVIVALRDGAEAVIPVVPVHDTVRRLGPDGVLGPMVDRSALVAVQTPQGFRRPVLVAAHEQRAGRVATDDAGLAEAIGAVVVAVPGAEESFKITTPTDLIRAASMARLPSASTSGGGP
jgi:2-C-methyl-D-erythritol 4-phosphate cytidylyltransferase